MRRSRFAMHRCGLRGGQRGNSLRHWRNIFAALRLCVIKNLGYSKVKLFVPSCLRVSPKNSPNHVDPAIQQRLGQAFIEGFGGLFHTFQPVLDLSRH